MPFLKSEYKNTYRILSGKKICYEENYKYHPNGLAGHRILNTAESRLYCGHSVRHNTFPPDHSGHLGGNYEFRLFHFFLA